MNRWFYGLSAFAVAGCLYLGNVAGLVLVLLGLLLWKRR